MQPLPDCRVQNRLDPHTCMMIASSTHRGTPRAVVTQVTTTSDGHLRCLQTGFTSCAAAATIFCMWQTLHKGLQVAGLTCSLRPVGLTCADYCAFCGTLPACLHVSGVCVQALVTQSGRTIKRQCTRRVVVPNLGDADDRLINLPQLALWVCSLLVLRGIQNLRNAAAHHEQTRTCKCRFHGAI
jgi:hypothetical protein